MTAATILYLLETGEPGVEAATLTVSDGETYTSRKFSTIFGATGCLNSNTDSEVNITFSGPTATFNFGQTVTDKTFTVKLFGKPNGYGASGN